MSLAIVNFGYGNVESIRLAFSRLGAETRLVSSAAEIAEAERLVLPGVGAAGFAMAAIRSAGLEQALRDYPRPLLGICLGMQLLFDHSEEGDTMCLGLLPGKVRALDPAPGRPVPHMGWSALGDVAEGIGLDPGDYVYFAHGFACDDTAATAARADYGRTIPAAVRSGNIRGAQFHPERSGKAGGRFLAAFLAT